MLEQLIELFEYIIATLGGMVLVTLLAVEIFLVIILVYIMIKIIIKEFKR